MNPEKHTFAGSINFSSNIDFFEIVNNKIELIKSLRLGDPINKPVNEEGIYYVDLTENTQTGYIDLSATSKYVYALYSDKKCTKITENQIPYWFLTGMVIRLKIFVRY